MTKQLNFIANLLIVSLPILIVTGPFLPDLSVIIIDIIFLGFLIKEKNLEPFNNKYFKYLLFFWMYFSLRSLFSEDMFYSLKSSFFSIRFIILIYAISYFLKKDEKLIKLFSKIFFLTILFICIDALIQSLTGSNLFNFSDIDEDKLNGVFNNEGVLGSYLVRLMPLLFALLYFLNLDKKKIILLTTGSIILLGAVIFLSGSRTAFVLLLLFLSFLFLSDTKLRKIIFFSSIIVFLSFLALSQISFKIYNIIDYTFKDPIRTMFYEKNRPENLEDKKFIIFTKVYHTHYETAFNIFLNNKFFGVGTKRFRKVCNDPKYYINEFSCTTHPHNFYMQMLAENGLIGFFGLLIVFLNITYHLFKKIILINFNPLKYKINSSDFILIGIFINLWPIIPSGNFFNNWLSILIYMPIGFYLFFNERQRGKH
tara:strand:+ start:46551 stop:47825 length:1275 start_codon:yes stop_codon:yes gene_type:complete